MEAHVNNWKAIAALHEQGYTEDFEQRGDNLLWIQQNVLLYAEDFVVKEHHHFQDTSGKERIAFAIISVGSYIKGILISKASLTLPA